MFFFYCFCYKFSHFCWFWKVFPLIAFWSKFWLVPSQSEQTLQLGKLFPETFNAIISLPMKPFPGRDLLPETFPGHRFHCLGTLPRKPCKFLMSQFYLNWEIKSAVAQHGPWHRQSCLKICYNRQQTKGLIGLSAHDQPKIYNGLLVSQKNFKADQSWNFIWLRYGIVILDIVILITVLLLKIY